MVDSLRNLQVGAEKKARIIRIIRQFGGRMSGIMNQDFSSWETSLKKDIGIDDLSLVTVSDIKSSMSDITNEQASVAVEYIKTLMEYKSRISYDLSTAKIPPNSSNPTA